MAEAAARKLRISRSRLYGRAIAEFLCRRDANAITDRLNQVYSREVATIDPAFERAQLMSFDKNSWRA